MEKLNRPYIISSAQPIEAGVRQSDFLEPYLYLVSTALMSIYCSIHITTFEDDRFVLAVHDLYLRSGRIIFPIQKIGKNIEKLKLIRINVRM